jgi:hypothetical protein
VPHASAGLRPLHRTRLKPHDPSKALRLLEIERLLGARLGVGERELLECLDDEGAEHFLS